jgi:hypothetical protein
MPAPSPLLDALAPHLTPDGLRAALRAALIDVVRENAGQLDATLNESGFIPAGASSTGPGFAAQTSNTEVIEGILITAGTTSESTASASGLIVTVGEYTIAVAPDSFDGAMFFLSGLKLVVTQPNRSVAIVSNTPALTPTVLPSPLYVVMWGYAAPASNAPGVLH